MKGGYRTLQLFQVETTPRSQPLPDGRAAAAGGEEGAADGRLHRDLLSLHPPPRRHPQHPDAAGDRLRQRLLLRGNIRICFQFTVESPISPAPLLLPDVYEVVQKSSKRRGANWSIYGNLVTLEYLYFRSWHAQCYTRLARINLNLNLRRSPTRPT